MKNEISSKKFIVFTILLLILITILTKFYGVTDVGDYADTAKFFAGSYNAKLRTSHSVLYGLIHAPFVKLNSNFLFLKLSAVLWLSLLTISLYYISNKNKKTLLLFITTPILWYIAPWITPIQLSSLLFLWGYYFINKYEKEEDMKYLLYSSFLIGLAWAFWDAIIYFAIILALCFLYNRKTIDFLVFLLCLFIGVSPKLIIDQVLFGFAFYSVLKHFFAVIAFTFYGGVYGQGLSSSNYLNIFFTLLFFPFYSYLLFSRKIFTKYKKQIAFLLLSTITILVNSQIRYTLLIVPIFILLLGETLNEKQFQIQLLIFLLLSLIVINPYLIQIKYETNGKEFNSFIKNLPNLQLNSTFREDIIRKDLNQIEKDFPNQKFIVGNKPDDYQYLSHLYWPDGKNNIKEFISIQDYKLWLQNKTIIAGKTFCSASKSWNRRDICFTIDLRKVIKDRTDYKAIEYAISLDEDLNLSDFKPVKKYNLLSVFKRSD